ncbi:MAG: hypothetical protein GYA36_22620 [Veillonellaceae bacterium]|nr:hypothetical protein [Veillonellaceae bacterium]
MESTDQNDIFLIYKSLAQIYKRQIDVVEHIEKQVERFKKSFLIKVNIVRFLVLAGAIVVLCLINFYLPPQYTMITAGRHSLYTPDSSNVNQSDLDDTNARQAYPLLPVLPGEKFISGRGLMSIYMVILFLLFYRAYVPNTLKINKKINEKRIEFSEEFDISKYTLARKIYGFAEAFKEYRSYPIPKYKTKSLELLKEYCTFRREIILEGSVLSYFKLLVELENNCPWLPITKESLNIAGAFDQLYSKVESLLMSNKKIDALIAKDVSLSVESLAVYEFLCVNNWRSTEGIDFGFDERQIKCAALEFFILKFNSIDTSYYYKTLNSVGYFTKLSGFLSSLVQYDVPARLKLLPPVTRTIVGLLGALLVAVLILSPFCLILKINFDARVLAGAAAIATGLFANWTKK